jgi:hypothetical protein
MGGGTGGGYSTPSGGLSSNIKSLAVKYPLDSEGKFGKPGKGKGTRRVASNDPESTGKEFFDKLSIGSKVKNLEEGKGKIGIFPDGSTVVYRPVSTSDGSPAMNLVMKGSSGPDYKIHFVKEVG